MNRRTFLKSSLAGIISVLGLSGGSYYYAREIEPSLLKMTYETIKHPKITSDLNNLKIVHFSDTHIGFHYTLQQLKELVGEINNLEPDIIVFTGDLVDEPQLFNWKNELPEILSQLRSTYGNYWIYGNHDHGGYGTEIVREAMDEANFILLQNSAETISVHNHQLNLVGLDDVMLGKPNIEEALQSVDESLFTLLLVHEPDYADTVKNYPVDVQLSGHSHGGQVRVPVIGDLYTPVYAEKYVQGKYIMEQHDLTLYVNSGIGTTRLPYRFLCKPELHIYTLEMS